MAQPQECCCICIQPHLNAPHPTPPCPTPPRNQTALPLSCPLVTHYFTERFSPYSLVMMDCMRNRLSCSTSTHSPSSAIWSENAESVWEAAGCCFLSCTCSKGMGADGGHNLHDWHPVVSLLSAAVWAAGAIIGTMQLLWHVMQLSRSMLKRRL